MTVITGLSGNEIYCLRRQGLKPGDLVIGNSVIALGLVRSLISGFRTLVGGEVHPITSLIHEGRARAYRRLEREAGQRGGVGITGVANELIFQGTNVEFLAIGSCLHRVDGSTDDVLAFSSSADGQALYCQLDCGFRPLKFVFGNVAYAVGLGGGLLGSLRSLVRGEVVEFSRLFNTIRHLALERIQAEAIAVGANAVVGIRTTILPFVGLQEMVMIGTASHHPALAAAYSETPITSDLTNEEMWNLIDEGLMPVQLVLGVSVYSLGLVGGLTAFFKSFVRGEIRELTTLIYAAREQALRHIEVDARRCGADQVVGIKTYVYNLGGGIVEFLAIGTAVKAMPGVGTHSGQLLPQAVIRDQDTFINTAQSSSSAPLNQPTNARGLLGSVGLLFAIVAWIVYVVVVISR
ncbi:heavy metal-binding domain-containing protein [Cyanobium sp. Morenito 9A2]|uniref:heavy metal-binding domain-containing protein n=1 Tax=Cyanobium sp. Morenito 9A2 TaxID=2823718 RepID=UPI0020CBBA48|nr:heavy metal-binding domain-containing protein [Cyanobium sp. Morenito 9A2]MCP9848886.1 heavy metal-binding domain-containing protein [Cyanobium sp. Morenito 9A2]